MSFPAKQVVDGFIEAMAKEPHNFRLTASHLTHQPSGLSFYILSGWPSYRVSEPIDLDLGLY